MSCFCCRSNALHVAASAGQVSMVRRVLAAVKDPGLMARMYPEETPEARAKRQEYLLDMFLNTPNKGHCETPLHQASKFGHLEVVALLAELSSCDVTIRNRAGDTAAEVACTRNRNFAVKGSNGGSGCSGDADLRAEIQKLLSTEVAYIPVFRDSNLAQPAFIGQLWSPRMQIKHDSVGPSEPPGSGPPLGGDSLTSMDLASISPIMVRHQLGLFRRSPPGGENSSNRGSPQPAGTKTAAGLTSNEKTPCKLPREDLVGTGGLSSPISVRQSAADQPSRGANQVGGHLSLRALLGPVSPADGEKIRREWKQMGRSPSLPVPSVSGDSSDKAIFGGGSGFRLLPRLTDPEKGLESEGRLIAKKYSANLIEYWAFLDSYCDVTSPVGLHMLEEHLEEMCGQMDMTSSSPAEKVGRASKKRQLDVSELGDFLEHLNLSDGRNRLDKASHPWSKPNPFGLALSPSSPVFNEASLDPDCIVIGAQEELMDLVGVKEPQKASLLSQEEIWGRARQPAHGLLDDTDPFEKSQSLDLPVGELPSGEAGLLENYPEGDDDADNFHTVASEAAAFDGDNSSSCSVKTAEEGAWVYLRGGYPTLDDCQLYDALREVHVDPLIFPKTKVWRDLVSSFPQEVRRSWRPFNHQGKNVVNDVGKVEGHDGPPSLPVPSRDFGGNLRPTRLFHQ